MALKEFLQNCTACGGNWGAMLLSGIKRVFPDNFEQVEDKYNSFSFRDGGIQAMEYLFNWLEEHGIIIDEEV